MSNEGKIVKIHYVGTLDDGEKFDSSYDRGEPIEFECMKGEVVKGFDEAVCDMQVGDKKKIHLEPEEAYGYRNENLIHVVPLEVIPNSEKLPSEGTIFFRGADDRPIPANIVAKDDKSITFDMNHPMAGKALNFELELLDVSDHE